MASTKIIVNNNGSLKIEGDFEIVDAQGNAYGLQGRTVLSLCRCGQSKNKPFCDGSHKEGFQHESTAFELPPRKVKVSVFVKKKECPSCAVEVDAKSKVCPICAYEFTGFSPGIKGIAILLIIVFLTYLLFNIL